MPKRKRRTYHHGDLRDTLISLALEMLERRGPEALTLRALAERAGVSGMAPYRHFADKTALLRAVAAYGFALLKESFVAVDDPANPRRAIQEFGLAYARFALERPGLFRLMFDGPPLLSLEEMEADPKTSYQLLVERIRQLVPPERARIAVIAFQSMIHGYCLLLANRRLRRAGPGPSDPRDLIPELGSILLRGIVGPAADKNV